MASSDKQRKNKKKKAPPHAWKPGQSGNPSGRPKKGFAIAERIRSAVGDDDWNEIISCAVVQAKEGDKSARDFLVDRTEGKPTQPTADVSSGWKDFLDGVIESKQE